MQRISRPAFGFFRATGVVLLGLALGCDDGGGERAEADDGPTRSEQIMSGTVPKEHAAETADSVEDHRRDAGATRGHEHTAEHEHTNRLINATSPYLLQHAHNPVDWYEWGPEALARAAKEDKPIFLSIGYSACHWCHVMERESFEDEQIAAIMNAHFVCIKVDREERPDLDAIYMAATQAFSGSGGWPMSVWLTPEDLQPFYAGTYFPPEGRYGRPGFKELLLHLAQVWKEDRDKALQQAGSLADAVRRMTSVEPGGGDVPQTVVVSAARQLARAFDPVKGGMTGGGRNKFPPSMAMDLMLRVYHHSLGKAAGNSGGTGGQIASGTRRGGERRLLEMVEVTLDKMAHGGINDHLGGGFARYSTDADWLVPHFEKMLYDQALISDIYLKGYQLTGKPLYASTARDIFDYVIADWQSPEGGFYSSRDADSEGVEGKFYVWTRGEVVEVLGAEDAELFCSYYDVTDGGNWEGHNILNVQRPVETVAKLHGISPADLQERLPAMRKKMFEAREKRVKPHLDDKILAAWNGLMIASMARGYRILGETRYRDAAVRAAEFILEKMVKEGRLQRTYRAGERTGLGTARLAGRAHTPAYLDDYAFMIEALLNLYETTFEVKWLAHAVALNEQVLRHFRDEGSGGFFFTADDSEKLLVRAKDADDGAIPSGNSVQLMNLLRLSVLLGRKDLADEADRLMAAFASQLRKMPYRSERLLSAVDFFHRRPREIAFVSTASPADGPKLEALVSAAWRTYVPNAVYACLRYGAPEAEALAKKIPLLTGKVPLGGAPAVYVCKDYACLAPTTDPAKLQEQIRR